MGRKENANAGKGIQIVEEMLAWFNKQYAQQSYLKITDLFDKQEQVTGTRVEIYLYAKYKQL